MSRQLTLGSLFDGIGGFPLAGIYAGMKPVWASEIEPFPIRVTSKRLPFMEHLGDIHALNGGEIEPVDVITFGSPCVDVSVAGRRSGINGTHSSLFFEAVRVITEMREKTNGTQPRWLVFENVPGLLSSGGSLDYRLVLESLIRVKDPEAVVPMPDKNKWLSAGEIQGCASALGGHYSLAWRIIDAAKGWGVAQRRRRVFVVVDLDGACAGQVLFESEGVSRYTPPRGEAREGTAGGAEAGAGASGGDGRSVGFEPGALRREGGHAWEDITGTLRADMGDNQAAVAIEFNPTDSRVKLKDDGICQTLTNRMESNPKRAPWAMKRGASPVNKGLAQTKCRDKPIVNCDPKEGGNQVPLTLKIRSGCEGGGKGAIWQENQSATLGCNNDQTLFAPKAYGISSDQSNAMLSDNPHSGVYEADTSRTLDCSGGSPSCNQGGIAIVEPIAFCANQRDEVRDLGNVAGTISANPGMKQQTFVAAFMGGQGSKDGGSGFQEEQSPTLKATASDGNTVPDVVYALQGSMIGRKDENGPQGDGINEQLCFTLNTVDRPAVATPAYSVRPLVNTGIQKEQTPSLTARDHKDAMLVSAPSYCMTVGSYGQVAKEKTPTLEARGYKDPPVVGKPPDPQPHETSYLVRRLTPGECCRLQGYPDGWTENLGTKEPTDAELRWWAGVFEDWYRAQGKATKPPGKARLVKWLGDPRTDGAEYKAYGNSVCVNCVLMIMQGIVWVENASLY